MTDWAEQADLLAAGLTTELRDAGVPDSDNLVSIIRALVHASVMAVVERLGPASGSGTSN